MNLHINGLIDYCSAAIVRDSFTLWKSASSVTITLEAPQGNRCSLSGFTYQPTKLMKLIK